MVTNGNPWKTPPQKSPSPNGAIEPLTRTSRRKNPRRPHRGRTPSRPRSTAWQCGALLSSDNRASPPPASPPPASPPPPTAQRPKFPPTPPGSHPRPPGAPARHGVGSCLPHGHRLLMTEMTLLGLVTERHRYSSHRFFQWASSSRATSSRLG